MRLSMIVFAVLAAVLQSGQETRDDLALRLLRPAAKRLDDGIAAFIKGAKPAEAFKPWQQESVPIDRSTALRGDMKSNGVTAAANCGIELEIQLWSAGKGVYTITLFAHVTPEEASIIAVTGHRFDSTAKAAVPVAKCAGEAEAFKDAAEYFVRRMKEGKPDALLFAEPERIVKKVPAQFREPFAAGMKQSKAGVADLCTAVSAVKFDEMRIQLGEQYYTSLGADGSTKDGFIRGKLKLSDAGDVVYRLNRFETE